MKRKCPLCGARMRTTSEPVVDREHGEVVYGAEHLLCDSCGFISFTPDQLNAYQKASAEPIRTHP